jgi:hypothetical protein
VPAPLAEGWFITLVGIFGPSLLAALLFLSRWIAARWREPYLSEQKMNAELLAELKETKEELAKAVAALNRAEIKEMFYEQRLASLEKELEGWREGRYRSNG